MSNESRHTVIRESIPIGNTRDALLKFAASRPPGSKLRRRLVKHGFARGMELLNRDQGDALMRFGYEPDFERGRLGVERQPAEQPNIANRDNYFPRNEQRRRLGHRLQAKRHRQDG